MGFLKLATLAASLLISGPHNTIPIDADTVGIGGAAPEDLADTLVSESINLGSKFQTNQITLETTVVWGTSTNFLITCEESPDDAAWYWIQRCTNADPQVCTKRKWSYSETTVTKIPTNIETNYRYLRCTWDDAADGTGTAVVTATRGLQ